MPYKDRERRLEHSRGYSPLHYVLHKDEYLEKKRKRRQDPAYQAKEKVWAFRSWQRRSRYGKAVRKYLAAMLLREPDF